MYSAEWWRTANAPVRPEPRPAPPLTVEAVCEDLRLTLPEFEELRRRGGFPKPFGHTSSGKALWTEGQLAEWRDALSKLTATWGSMEFHARCAWRGLRGRLDQRRAASLAFACTAGGPTGCHG